MNTLQDLRFGFRILFKNKGFTVVAVLTLALGIGASTAVFSIVNAILLKPLPYPHAERIVIPWRQAPSGLNLGYNALGAERHTALAMIVGQGARLAALGIAIGLAAALAATQLLANQLYGVTATDPLTFAAVSLLLVGVALLACYIPARRAMKVEPTVALRCD